MEKINRLDAQKQEEEVKLVVYRLRLANNMQDEKLEKVVGKMKNSHLALLGRTLPQCLALVRDCPPYVSPTLHLPCVRSPPAAMRRADDH